MNPRLKTTKRVSMLGQWSETPTNKFHKEAQFVKLLKVELKHHRGWYPTDFSSVHLQELCKRKLGNHWTRRLWSKYKLLRTSLNFKGKIVTND